MPHADCPPGTIYDESRCKCGSGPRPWSDVHQHQILQQILGLARNYLLQDVVFISIDFEADMHHPLEVYELGVALLDMRDLCSDNADTSSVIQTKQLLCGRRCIAKAIKRHMLDNSELLPNADVFETLKSIFCIPDDQKRPSLRKIVIVGHDLAVEANVMKRLGFSPTIAPIVGYLDTLRIGRQLFGTWLTLTNLLYRLKIPFPSHGLHIACNDAHFTLKALLQMAVVDVEESAFNAEEFVRDKRLGTLAALADIALSPWSTLLEKKVVTSPDILDGLSEENLLENIFETPP